MNQDPYYVPPHISAPFKKEEVEAYIAVYRHHDVADGDADGFIEVDALDELLKAVGETPTDAKVIYHIINSFSLSFEVVSACMCVKYSSYT
jgi:Ca2+-binding EF-hand superfamily protein